MAKYIDQFDFYIGDDNCQIGVISFTGAKPNHRADNPDDYYGYVDIEFEIMDSNGKFSKALTAAATELDIERIEIEIQERVEQDTYDGADGGIDWDQYSDYAGAF